MTVLPDHVRKIVAEIETEIGEEPEAAIEGAAGRQADGNEGWPPLFARSWARSARIPIARAWPGRRAACTGCTRS